MRCITACQFLPSVIAFLGFQISVAFAATCLFCAAQRIIGVCGRSAHIFHCQQVCRLPCAVSLNEISQLLLVPGIFLLVCAIAAVSDPRGNRDFMVLGGVGWGMLTFACTCVTKLMLRCRGATFRLFIGRFQRWVEDHPCGKDEAATRGCDRWGYRYWTYES